jgi:hypothetical protein
VDLREALVTILEEPKETSPSERKGDAERARIISSFVNEAIDSTKRGISAPLFISVHKLITDDENDGLYALYFLPAAGSLFMCTIQVQSWEDALEDVRTWLAKTSGVSADQLKPIELDTTYAPRLRSGFVEEP